MNFKLTNINQSPPIVNQKNVASARALGYIEGDFSHYILPVWR
jgi:hypothetical protein